MILSSLLLAGVTVALPPEKYVGGTSLSVGDVASVSGVDSAEVERVRRVSLGRAPLPGYSRLIQRERLVAVIERELPSLEVRAAGEFACRVWPEVETLAPEELRAEAARALARAFAGRDVTFELRSELQALEVPTGEIELRAEVGPAEAATGTLPVPVRVHVDGAPFRTVWTAWDVRRWETLPVLMRPVQAGTPLDASYFRRERVLVDAAERAPLAVAALEGAVTTRALAAGEVVREGDVHRAVVVVPGATLSLEVVRGPIVARVPAVARGAAAVGDRLRVATGDGRELTATLVAPDVARIVVAGGKP